MLKIDNIEFSYQEIKVLKKIDLYIEKQDFRLSFYSEIQVDFLQFISVKDIYKK